MIRANVFDIGGVAALDIWENVFLHPTRGLAALFHLDRDELIRFGREFWEDFAYRSAPDEDEIGALEREYWTRFISRFAVKESPQFFIEKSDEFVQAVPGMDDLVRILHRSSIKLGLCSNNTEFFHRRLRHRLDFLRCFPPKTEVMSSRVGCSKSSAGFEMFRVLESAMGVPRNEILFIDDRSCNLECAVEFGLNGVMFSRHSSLGAAYLRRLIKLTAIEGYHYV